jgi:hypothetical protein
VVSFPQVRHQNPVHASPIRYTGRLIVARTSPVAYVGLNELEGLRKTSSANKYLLHDEKFTEGGRKSPSCLVRLRKSCCRLMFGLSVESDISEENSLTLWCRDDGSWQSCQLVERQVKQRFDNCLCYRRNGSEYLEYQHVSYVQGTLELRPAWHRNNLGYDQNFSFDLRPKCWVTTRMPVKAKTSIRFCGCKQRPEMRS